MKLVQFPDGRFGIRRGIPPFCTYLDFEAIQSDVELWHSRSRYADDCRRESALIALSLASKLKRRPSFCATAREWFRSHGEPVQDVRRGAAK